MNINNLKWPTGEIDSIKRGGRYHMASAICERGDQITRSMGWRQSSYIPEKCIECGAEVLTGCKKCGVRIPGETTGGDIFFSAPPNWLPYFCESCGSMYPWATKRQRIFELENRLRLEGVEEADYATITEQLEKLLDENLSPEGERKIWEKIKIKAGAFFFSENVKDIATSLMTKVLRDQLGI